MAGKTTEKTEQDYLDAGKALRESNPGYLQTAYNNNEPEHDGVALVHEHEHEHEKEEHELIVHQRTVNEHTDGTSGNAIAGGIINTAEADAKLASSSLADEKKKKEKEHHHRLMILLEQIEWLNQEIERLDGEIEKLDEQIATKEELLDALREGRELTEAQKILAEKYKKEDGEYDLNALMQEIDGYKDERKDLVQKRGDLEDQKEEAVALAREGEENPDSPAVQTKLKAYETTFAGQEKKDGALFLTERNEGKEKNIKTFDVSEETGSKIESLLLDEGLYDYTELAYGTSFDFGAPTEPSTSAAKEIMGDQNMTSCRDDFNDHSSLVALAKKPETELTQTEGKSSNINFDLKNLV